jgi:hypothetical protein
MVYAAARNSIASAQVCCAIIASSIMPLTYYAKTSNLDVPHLFWLSLALVAYIKCGHGGRVEELLRIRTGRNGIDMHEGPGLWILHPSRLSDDGEVVPIWAADRPTGRPCPRRCGE